MAVQIGFTFEDWLKEVDQSKEDFFRDLLGEIDATFYDEVMFRTPEDDVTKKGKAKAPQEHVKMAWEHMIDQAGRGVEEVNDFVYAHVLDLGKYQGVGPRTVAGEDGGIYSTMAPKGIIQAFLKDEKLLKGIVRTIVKKMQQRSPLFGGAIQ